MKYKTFKDLTFKQHLHFPMFSKQATMDFPNRYGISVINGGHSRCSDGTYEVAILYDGVMCFNTGITRFVLTYCTVAKVTRIMQRIQKLNK